MTMQEEQANVSLQLTVTDLVVSSSPLQPSQYSAFDTPHIITTYAALLSLAILRDDFTRLDRQGMVAFLRSCQRQDGR